jgi:hypothetical protein
VDPLEEAEVQGTLFTFQQYTNEPNVVLCSLYFEVCFSVDPLEAAEVQGTLFHSSTVQRTNQMFVVCFGVDPLEAQGTLVAVQQ